MKLISLCEQTSLIVVGKVQKVNIHSSFSVMVTIEVIEVIKGCSESTLDIMISNSVPDFKKALLFLKKNKIDNNFNRSSYYVPVTGNSSIMPIIIKNNIEYVRPNIFNIRFPIQLADFVASEWKDVLSQKRIKLNTKIKKIDKNSHLVEIIKLRQYYPIKKKLLPPVAPIFIKEKVIEYLNCAKNKVIKN